MTRTVTLPGGKTVRRAPKNKVPGGVRCNAPKKDGSKCNLAAGWGTNHQGLGPCKLHGGNLPNVLKSLMTKELSTYLGREIEIDPINALMWLVRLGAGDVQYWRTQLMKLQRKAEADYGDAATGLIEDTLFGEQLKLAGRKYEEAQLRLAKHAKMALDAGIAERAIRLQEAYGEAIATLIAKIRDDLIEAIPEHTGLRQLLREKAQEIIPRRLMELEQPRTDVNEDPEQQLFGDIEDGEWQEAVPTEKGRAQAKREYRERGGAH